LEAGLDGQQQAVAVQDPAQPDAQAGGDKKLGQVQGKVRGNPQEQGPGPGESQDQGQLQRSQQVGGAQAGGQGGGGAEHSGLGMPLQEAAGQVGPGDKAQEVSPRGAQEEGQPSPAGMEYRGSRGPQEHVRQDRQRSGAPSQEGGG